MDCGVAALAMLCDVTYEEAERAIPWRREGNLRGTYTRQLREGGFRLGYYTKSTPQDRLKPIIYSKFRAQLPPNTLSNVWYLMPDNSLVKVPHPEGIQHGSHWVVWRNGKIYDPARGVFRPAKYNGRPTSYMHFMKREIVYV